MFSSKVTQVFGEFVERAKKAAPMIKNPIPPILHARALILPIELPTWLMDFGKVSS